jgi:hypothetical protein
LLRGYSLRRKLPERVRFKEIDKQIMERLRNGCLQFPVEIERGCERWRSCRSLPSFDLRAAFNLLSKSVSDERRILLSGFVLATSRSRFRQ